MTLGSGGCSSGVSTLTSRSLGTPESVKQPVHSSPATEADPPLSSLSAHGPQESQVEWGPQAQLPHGFVRRLQSLGSEKEMKRPSYLPNMFYEKFCSLGY